MLSENENGFYLQLTDETTISGTLDESGYCFFAVSNTEDDWVSTYFTSPTEVRNLASALQHLADRWSQQTS